MFGYLDYLDKTGKYKIVDYLLKKTASRNPLEVLGLTTNSTQDELKSAYRRLVKKWHPDVNSNDPDAPEKFRQIDEAYKIINENPDRYFKKRENISKHPFLLFFNSPEFLEFYNSNVLPTYYRFQTGRIRKKDEKEKAQSGISWFKFNLTAIINRIYLDNPNTYWSISNQNIINLFSRARSSNQDISVPIQLFEEYFEESLI